MRVCVRARRARMVRNDNNDHVDSDLAKQESLVLDHDTEVNTGPDVTNTRFYDSISFLILKMTEDATSLC
jgi:hypothetical protein